jgi:hypothetical protein
MEEDPLGPVLLYGTETAGHARLLASVACRAGGRGRSALSAIGIPPLATNAGARWPRRFRRA